MRFRENPTPPELLSWQSAGSPELTPSPWIFCSGTRNCCPAEDHIAADLLGQRDPARQSELRQHGMCPGHEHHHEDPEDANRPHRGDGDPIRRHAYGKPVSRTEFCS